MYVCMYVCMYVHIYTYTHTHTYTRTYIISCLYPLNIQVRSPCHTLQLSEDVICRKEDGTMPLKPVLRYDQVPINPLTDDLIFTMDLLCLKTIPFRLCVCVCY